MLNAIEKGIIPPSTKEHLEAGAGKNRPGEANFKGRGLENPIIDKEQIIFWVYRLRNLDITKQEHRQQLVDTFVNSSYLFDEKLVLTFNYKDRTKSVSLAEIKGWDLTADGPSQTGLNVLFKPVFGVMRVVL